MEFSLLLRYCFSCCRGIVWHRSRSPTSTLQSSSVNFSSSLVIMSLRTFWDASTVLRGFNFVGVLTLLSLAFVTAIDEGTSVSGADDFRLIRWFLAATASWRASDNVRGLGGRAGFSAFFPADRTSLEGTLWVSGRVVGVDSTTSTGVATTVISGLASVLCTATTVAFTGEVTTASTLAEPFALVLLLSKVP